MAPHFILDDYAIPLPLRRVARYGMYVKLVPFVSELAVVEKVGGKKRIEDLFETANVLV